MTESTRRWITQILLPAVFLFGSLAFMHGPAYVTYFKKQWVDYRLARDSIFGPERYEVRLKAGFVSQTGEDCLVMVLSDKTANHHSDEPSRQEVILLDSWSRIVQRDLHENAGAIQSTHLSPQDGGYAVLEIVRRVPDNRHMAEVARYQVTAERIDAMDSELRRRAPMWDDRGGWEGWKHRGHGHHRHRWSRGRHDERHSHWRERHDDRREAFDRQRDGGDDPQPNDEQPEEPKRERDRLPPQDAGRHDTEADLAWLAR